MIPAARVAGLVFVSLSAVAAGGVVTWVVVGADLEVQDVDTTTTWLAPPTTARFALGPTTYPPLNLPSTTRAAPAPAPTAAAPMPTVTTPGQPGTTTAPTSTTAGAQTSGTRVGAIPLTTLAPTTTAAPTSSTAPTTTEAPTTTQGTTTTSTPAFAVLGGPCGDIGLIRPVLGGLGDLAICALPGVWQLWAPTTTTGAP